MLEIELLDRAKKITGSDYKTAQRLGTSPQRLSNIRAGRRHMDEWIAGRIAELEGKKPWEAICALRAEQAKNYKEMKDWKRWAGAAVVTLSTALFCASGLNSEAYAQGIYPQDIHYAHIWISRNIKKRGKQRLQSSRSSSSLRIRHLPEPFDDAETQSQPFLYR